MIAIQYARWSSMEQSKGSTLARQLEATAAHIEMMRWELRGEPLIDKGRSAYTGDNLENGQLGQFASSIHSGAVDASNLVLVVEELDRLSRQPADVMLSWLSPLVRRGLTIKVVNTGQTISRAMLDHDMGGLMMILIGAFGSFTESRKKAERVSAAWEAKREAARNGQEVQRGHRRPKWVEIAADGSFLVPENKALIIRLIFDMRIRGHGKWATAKKLNELAQTDATYAPWALGAGEGKAPALWRDAYIARILTNRAVLGEWQPMHRPKKGEHTTAGEPIEGYYPVVIDAATFARANDPRVKRTLKTQGRGRGLGNLLGSRAVCGICGGNMVGLGNPAHFTGRDGKVRRYYNLYCNAAKIAKACGNARGWPYDKVEAPLLDRILTLAMDDQHFGGSADTASLEAAVHNARATVAETERKITILIDTLETVASDAVRDRLVKRQRELSLAQKTVEQAQDDLEAARGKVSPSEHIRRVSEVRAMMWAEDEEERFEARRKIKEALGDVIETMKFDPETGNIFVNIKDGAAVFTIGPDGDIFRDFDLTKDTDDFHHIGDPQERATMAAYARRRLVDKSAGEDK